MRLILSLSALVAAAILGACSDYDEQDFTVLLPNAGVDTVFFTEESGNEIGLDASASSDVNGLGFTFLWEIVDFPEGFRPELSGANTAKPTLTVNPETSGRVTMSMIISRGEQQARDFVNIDINPLFANLLLVNAIAGDTPARLRVPSLGIEGEEVARLSADSAYYEINLNEARDGQGNVALEVGYGDATIPVAQPMDALGFYTLYLAGTPEAPEALLVEKTRNPNTQPPAIAGLEAINLSQAGDMVLFADASEVGFGEVPLDVLFGAIGVTEAFGTIGVKQSNEISLPTRAIRPLAIWATANGTRISENAFINLAPRENGRFGTFVLFDDSGSDTGFSLKFIDNSSLLP